MRRQAWWLVCLLAGCAAQTPRPAPVPMPPPPVAEEPTELTVTVVERAVRPAPLPAVPPQAAQLLPQFFHYYDRVRKLNGGDYTRELEAARNAFSVARSDENRLRYGLLLSLPGATGADDTRALDVLDPLVKGSTGEAQRLAHFLATYIQEQRRLSVALAGQQKEVQALQQQAQGLQQKLDALKTLERSLLEREQSGAARKR